MKNSILKIAGILAIAATTCSCSVLLDYNIYAQKKAGEAELARASMTRQIAIEEAKAKLESAKLLADSEVVRAKGVAEANKIIGDSLKGNEAYLRYLWIDGIKQDQNQIIYVPTEAGLPILEAGKRS